MGPSDVALLLRELRELDISHNPIIVGMPAPGPPRLWAFWTGNTRFTEGTLEVPWSLNEVLFPPSGAMGAWERDSSAAAITPTSWHCRHHYTDGGSSYACIHFFLLRLENLHL